MFKTVKRHVRFVEAFLASVFTLVGDVAGKLARRVKPFLLPGEKVSAAELAATLVTVGRIVEGEARALHEAESTHRFELKKERRLRERRRKDAAALYRKLLRVRRALESFGRGTAALTVGLDAKIVNAKPEVLVRYGRETVKVLSRPDFELPGHVPDADTFDARRHAKAVRPALRQYEKTDDELADQIPRTRAALAVKLERLEAFKKTYRYGKWAVEGLYGLAGEEFHLERLEPKRGKRKRKKKPPATDAAATQAGVAKDET